MVSFVGERNRAAQPTIKQEDSIALSFTLVYLGKPNTILDKMNKLWNK